MMMHSREYQRILEPHRRALSQLELDFQFFLADVGDIDLYSVTSRLKGYGSAVAKSQRLNIEITALDDLAGMRIIVGTRADIPIIERFFSRQEYGKDLIITKTNNYSRKSGYRAKHIIVELCSHYQRSVRPGRVEVQIQTIFQHAFNFLSRSWIYKSNLNLSDVWQKQFLELSENLSRLEEIADNLHTSVTSENSMDDSAILTPHTYKLIISNEFNEEVSYEDAVDIVRYYKDLGVENNGQMRSFFRRRDIATFYNELINDIPDVPLIKLLKSQGKASFWAIYGTRLNSRLEIKEFFYSLKSSSAINPSPDK